MAPKATGNKPFTGTDVVHADDHVPHGLEVAPAISVTTSKYNSTSTEAVRLIQGHKAFRSPGPWDESKGITTLDPWNPERHVYSRYTQATTTRVEKVLSKVNVSKGMNVLEDLN